MRVLLVSGSIPPEWCGVGDYAALLAGGFAAQSGVEAGILTARGEMHDPRVTVLRTRDWSAWRTRSILKTIRAWRPDVVHFQYPTEGYRGQGAPWLLPLLCRLGGLQVVLTWHEDRPRLHPAEIFNTLLPGGVVTARPQLRLSPLGRLLARRKTIRYIPVGCTIPVVRLSDDERQRIRARFGGERLIAYFGFAYPHKRMEDLFDMIEERDALVLVCTLDARDDYQRRILELSGRARCTVTGPLPARDVAEILASADAVVLPFANGAGPWNSSLRGARMQGTFVLTTSNERRGYDAEQNVYYARPADVAEMREALQRYSGTRRPPAVEEAGEEWRSMARAHLDFYRELGIA